MFAAVCMGFVTVLLFVPKSQVYRPSFYWVRKTTYMKQIRCKKEDTWVGNWLLNPPPLPSASGFLYDFLSDIPILQYFFSVFSQDTQLFLGLFYRSANSSSSCVQTWAYFTESPVFPTNCQFQDWWVTINHSVDRSTFCFLTGPKMYCVMSKSSPVSYDFHICYLKMSQS